MNSARNSSTNPQHIIVSWRYLYQELIKILPEQTRSQMSQWEKQDAEGEVAKNRINDLTPSAQRDRNPQTKKAVNILVGAMSAITFSAGGQILTSGLGSLSVPASLVIGGAAGILADKKVMQVVEHARKKSSTQQALKDIDKQQQVHPPKNELGELYFQSKRALVLQVEGQNLRSQSPTNVILAVGLSGTEYAMSLGIVMGLGLPGGIVLNAIAASLPVVMLWTAASLQNDAFEMPKHDRALIDQYEHHLPKEIVEVEAIQIVGIDEEIAIEQRELAYQQALAARREKFVSEGDTSGRLKNWDMAEADFQLDWYLEEKQKIENELDEKREQRLFQLKADIAKIREQYQPPAGTYSPAQMEELKFEWAQAKEAELTEDFASDIRWMNHKYGNKIKHLEEEMEAARLRYSEAESRWREERNAHRKEAV
jgi:hypothetical protein